MSLSLLSIVNIWVCAGAGVCVRAFVGTALRDVVVLILPLSRCRFLLDLFGGQVAAHFLHPEALSHGTLGKGLALIDPDRDTVFDPDEAPALTVSCHVFLQSPTSPVVLFDLSGGQQ